jgi:DNA replication protein DnaC
MHDKFTELLQDTSSYPYIFLYGNDGNGGLWKTRNVPAKYSDCFMENLPIESENPTAYATIQKYSDNILHYVQDKKVGLFLFSKPTQEISFGTGTGKTQSAITLLNHYLLARVRQHVTGELRITDNPVYFCKSTDLQTLFNSQFRGSPDMQRAAGEKYYSVKARVKAVDFLVLDDVATRASSEAYTEELYEIIDHRATEELVTVFTSNVNMEEVTKLLGDRIASRIHAMTVPVVFTGRDYRRKVL